MNFTDAVGQPLDRDDRVAHLSSYGMKSGNAVLTGTVVGFTEKLIQVLIDGEDKPKNLNNCKLVLIKDQTPYENTLTPVL